jgi:very-short-patch-repair endonuclease
MPRSIVFESMTYDEAVERFHLGGMPRPAVNEVRVVSVPVTKEGDFCLDEDEEEDEVEDLFLGAWLFLGGLHVKGALTNTEMDAGPVLAVKGTLRAERWWLTGLDARIWGDVVIERLLITEYSHGSLRVDGEIEAPVVLISGHCTELAFRRQLVIGSFIVDFACTKVRLAVEVDGPYHEARARLDARRDRALRELGWAVLRIQDHLVFKDLDAVVASVVAAASARR